MAFEKATVLNLHQLRDSSSVVIGLYFLIELRDTLITEPRNFIYEVVGDEFAGVPPSGAARRTALIAIIKREAHSAFDKWVAERAARPSVPVVRDIVADLGTNEFTTFTGEAPPLPTE